MAPGGPDESFRTIMSMATVTIQTLVDDIDGSEAAETIWLALDGASYEIDLSAENAAKLRDNLAKFIDAAAPVKPQPMKKFTKQVITTPSSKEQASAVRAWATQNGFTISERGRIPKNVLDAFNEAH